MYTNSLTNMITDALEALEEPISRFESRERAESSAFMSRDDPSEEYIERLVASIEEDNTYYTSLMIDALTGLDPEALSEATWEEFLSDRVVRRVRRAVDAVNDRAYEVLSGTDTYVKEILEAMGDMEERIRSSPGGTMLWLAQDGVQKEILGSEEADKVCSALYSSLSAGLEHCSVEPDFTEKFECVVCAGTDKLVVRFKLPAEPYTHDNNIGTDHVVSAAEDLLTLFDGRPRQSNSYSMEVDRNDCVWMDLFSMLLAEVCERFRGTSNTKKTTQGENQ